VAVGILASLPASARAAYPLIQRGVREGLSSNRILEGLVKAGLGIKRQTGLDIIRAERGVQLEGGALRNLRRTAVFNPERLPEAMTKLRRKFSFQVELRGVDLNTGENTVRLVTVSTDNAMTRNDIEAHAQAFADDDQNRYGIIIESVQLVHGLKAGAAGTL
jgi:hypothetical protein